MAPKRKIISVKDESDNASNDSDIVTFKKKKINIFDDSDTNESQTHNSDHTSTNLSVTEDEYCDEHDSFNFVEKSGPQHSLPRNAKAIEYFNLFYTSSLWTLMVEETNRYADELLKTSLISTRSRMTNWYPVTVLEMKAFVAVLLEMGITRRPTISSYWTENSRSIPWFKKMFSRNRFQLILRCFHLVNNENCFPPGHEKYDAYAKFDPIIQHANKTFQLYYTPHKKLSIDESLVGTLCHSSITQHLPNKKHHKCRNKFWLLCDATSNYCMGVYCYRGAESEINNEIEQMGLGYNVVVNLLQQSNCLNKGHHVYVDNYFTSTALAKFLYSKNTYLMGTKRGSRKDLPNNTKQTKVSETKYFQDNEIPLSAYHGKKSSTEDVTVIKKEYGKEKQKIKRQNINGYNHFMCGVDESDKMLYTYLDERRALKYWKKVTFNIFTRMVLNSYLIYKETVGKKAISQLQYTSDVIVQIEHEWTQKRKCEFIINERKTYGLKKLQGRNLRQCVVCSSKEKGIRRSNLICAQCEKGLHPLCLDKHQCIQ